MSSATSTRRGRISSMDDNFGVARRQAQVPFSGIISDTWATCLSKTPRPRCLCSMGSAATRAVADGSSASLGQLVPPGPWAGDLPCEPRLTPGVLSGTVEAENIYPSPGGTQVAAKFERTKPPSTSARWSR